MQCGETPLHKTAIYCNEVASQCIIMRFRVIEIAPSSAVNRLVLLPIHPKPLYQLPHHQLVPLAVGVVHLRHVLL